MGRLGNSVPVVLIAFSAAVALLSCAGDEVDRPIRPSITTDIDTITFISSHDANQDDEGRTWPVEVDVVRYTDERALTRIAQLSASEWFEQDQTILSDYPDLLINNWEITAGVTLGPQDISLDEYVGGFIFANYQNQLEPHRRRLNVNGDVRVYLDRTMFRVEGDPPGGWW